MRSWLSALVLAGASCWLGVPARADPLCVVVTVALVPPPRGDCVEYPSGTSCLSPGISTDLTGVVAVLLVCYPTVP